MLESSSENNPGIAHIAKCSGIRESVHQLDFTSLNGWSTAFHNGGNDGCRSCLKFHVRPEELRPINMAIRIWKRV
jgi:hypothetical protein